MINVKLIDQNTVEIPGAVRVTETPQGFAVTFLTTPDKTWRDPVGRNIGGLNTGFKQEKLRPQYRGRFGRNYTVFTDSDAVTKDPHYYDNGNNGLMVPESVSRTCERLLNETFRHYLRDTIGGDHNQLATLVRALIKGNSGRDYVYKLAGKAKNMYASGGFSSSNIIEIMQWMALMDGELSAPVITSKRSGA